MELEKIHNERKCQLVTIHLRKVLLKSEVLDSNNANHSNNLIIESEKKTHNGKVRVGTLQD